jgi:hypothetical protein
MSLEKRYAKISVIAILGFIIFAIIFRWIGGDSFKVKDLESKMPDRTTVVGEIVINNPIKQEFVSEYNSIDTITVVSATYYRQNMGNLNVEITDANTGELLASKTIPMSDFQDNENYDIKFDKPLTGVKGKHLAMTFSTNDAVTGNAITLWYNNTDKNANRKLYINGVETAGTLCFSQKVRVNLAFGRFYWMGVAGVVILMIAYAVNWCVKTKNGKQTIGGYLFWIVDTYKFLYKQLIARDFKTKYKRSFLGMCWSFLNPLLTMVVQYVVFSTLFKSDIKNYPVYLLTGIVFFNFFSEAITLGLMSITGNASLITKVYVPKYIYPITRVLSSSINLLISMVPLIFVAILVGTQLKVSTVLLVFSISCMIVFSIGITFMLSSAMVFFRDTQFLWGIISMIWMYATPIFYPESILPDNMKWIHHMNPLYYFVKFSRIAIIDGVSPEPRMYAICLGCALGSFIIGALIFKKTQDKFALYL